MRHDGDKVIQGETERKRGREREREREGRRGGGRVIVYHHNM